VGTEEKRKFLEDNYGIPRSRMFSSRNTNFAQDIMRETNGRGVNVVINSLVGELLDASWRILADGGNMVEIGKRDIVDRNTLSMEPFDRNCSFRAVDFSYTRDIKDSLIARFVVPTPFAGLLSSLTFIPVSSKSSSSSLITAISHPLTPSPPSDSMMLLPRYPISGAGDMLARLSYATQTERIYWCPSDRRYVGFSYNPTPPTSLLAV
jgi:hypothetical protein